nr:hypothetical protein [Candidatus Sigynarchaeum springense]
MSAEDLTNIFARTRRVRDVIYELALTVSREGSPLWEAYTAMSPPTSADVPSMKAWRDQFAEKIFGMLMADPGNAIWDQLPGRPLLPVT